jgi:hypothetical protein
MTEQDEKMEPMNAKEIRFLVSTMEAEWRDSLKGRYFDRFGMIRLPFAGHGPFLFAKVKGNEARYIFMTSGDPDAVASRMEIGLQINQDYLLETLLASGSKWVKNPYSSYEVRLKSLTDAYEAGMERLRNGEDV